MSFTASLIDIVDENGNQLLSAHSSWTRVELGEVASILNGFAFPSARFSNNGGTPLIRIRDIVRNETETSYHGDYDEQYIVQPGKLIVGMDGDFNCTLWKGSPALLNQRVCRISPIEQFYNRQFLSHLLPGYLAAINAHTSSITVKHLSSRTVERIPLPLPPINEQKRIAEKLDELFSDLDAGVAALARAGANLKRYRASVLKAAVEGRLTEKWRAEHPDMEPVDQLLERILAERRRRWIDDQLAKWRTNKSAAGWAPTKTTANEEAERAKITAKYKAPAAPDSTNLPALPKGWCYSTLVPLLVPNRSGTKTGPFGSLLKKHEHQPYGVPVLGIENIDRMRFIPGSKIYITPQKAQVLSEYSAQEGDVIISRSGTVGEVCVVPAGLGEARISTNLMRVRLASRGLLPSFLCLLLNGSPAVLNQISSLCSGSTRDFLNTEILLLLLLPVPPIAEQSAIVTLVEEQLSVIESSEHFIEMQSSRAMRLRQSILKRAFEGKLVPQDPNDEPADALLNRIREGPTLSKEIVMDQMGEPAGSCGDPCDDEGRNNRHRQTRCP